MSVSPQEHENKRSEAGFTAVETARANLSYDPPSTSRPWRKIAAWAIVLILTLAGVLLARHLTPLFSHA